MLWPVGAMQSKPPSSAASGMVVCAVRWVGVCCLHRDQKANCKRAITGTLLTSAYCLLPASSILQHLGLDCHRFMCVFCTVEAVVYATLLKQLSRLYITGWMTWGTLQLCAVKMQWKCSKNAVKAQLLDYILTQITVISLYSDYSTVWDLIAIVSCVCFVLWKQQ